MLLAFFFSNGEQGQCCSTSGRASSSTRDWASTLIGNSFTTVDRVLWHGPSCRLLGIKLSCRTLIRHSDLSFAAYQYQQFGHVTTSMMIVTLFHTIYVVDFFYNEDWYTRTIDISHDHFGFMLAWGDTTFLPTFYTLQVQYLARYPTYLTRTQSLAILAFGLSGYFIFRSANFQRDHVRAHDGNTTLWGKPAEVIRVKYTTSDGKIHKSLLLTSGWWGFSRHANYLGDLMLTWSMCATCGFTHFIPWSYFVFMTTLLYHRSIRDDKRCRAKYGKHWEEYCEKVPYVFVPGII